MSIRHPLIGVAAFLVTTSLHADVLNDHDNGPFTGIFGMPDSTEGANLLGRGEQRWDTFVQTASHSIIETSPGEAILLDGETTRFELGYRIGLSDRLEVGIEIPYLWHESGGLDTLIDSWHDAFGFPGRFREVRPQDVLQFTYIETQGTTLDLSNNANGLGDVRVIAGWRLGSREDSRHALRFGVKLPTGDGATLLGSGGTDVSVGLAGDFDNAFGQPSLTGFYRLSAVRIGEPDLLPDRYRELVGQASFGMGWNVSSLVELRAQATVRTAAYDSAIETLGETAATLTVGGSLRFSEQWRLSIAVAEDIKVNSAPDVAFQLGLHYRP